MKIPNKLAAQLLIESETFRDWVIARLNVSSCYYDVIMKKIAENPSNKIAVIKFIRETCSSKDEFLAEFGADFSENDFYDGRTLGLAAAKRLAEEMIEEYHRLKH